MAKTVTVTTAKPGSTTVRVGSHTFPVGEPVRDVPDTTIEQLKAMPGIAVHVAAGKRDAPSTPDEDEE